MEPIVIVGAGVAGLSCAQALTAAGREVVLLDRGRRGPGGRIGTRRLGEGSPPVGIGPPGFTVTDPAFGAAVRKWVTAGLVAEPKDGWAAVRDPQGLAAGMAEGLPVRLGTTVEHVGPGPAVDGRPAAAVVLAMPGPQAVRLLDPGSATAGAPAGDWVPTIVVAARFAERTWPHKHVRRLDGPDLELVVDDGEAPVLVLHATPERSARHLEGPDAAVGPLLAALDLGKPLLTHAHRWTFARPARPSTAPFHLGDDGIGLCGDGWHAPATGVEAAWLSGRRIAEALLA